MTLQNKNLIYDFIIVGAGPCALTIATFLANKYKILLIDKENSIGGCHRVKRVDNSFTEHGPRIYMGGFVNFQKMLKLIGTDFNDLFIKYKFSIGDIGGDVYDHLSIKELTLLGYKFFTFNDNDIKNTMNEFMNYHNFSVQSKDYIDRLCRLTDGAGSDRYTVYEFFQLINQNFLYNTYQPQQANDLGLFKIWGDYLEKTCKNNLKIMLNTEVIRISPQNITLNNGQIIEFENLVLAIPPYNIQKIISKSPLKLYDNDVNNNRINFKVWEKLVRYETYIPIQFIWNKKLELPKVWGFPKTKWGIAHILLSDYADFDGKTVISTCITKANEAKHIKEKKIIIDEVFNQLKESFPNIPKYDKALMENNKFCNTGTNNSWESVDNAFMLTKYGSIPFETNYPNIYTCGTHNGKSVYSFTSMESAVTNAMEFVNYLDSPEIKKIDIKSGITLHLIIKLIILTILTIIIIYKIFIT